jgi:hypothetical protein
MAATTDMTSPRTRRARFRSLDAERIAPGMFEVERLTADGEDNTHTVDLQEGACDCEDYTYRMGPAGGECYHLRFVRLIADGVLCPTCGYEVCRPSCPERSTDFEEANS